MASHAAQRPLQGLAGVVFDMDGTLTEDGAIDFAAMRRACNVPPGRGILEYVTSLPHHERRAGEALIQRIEREGYDRMALNHACTETIQALRGAGLKLGILTRNTDEAVQRFMERFQLHDHFDICLSREWDGPPKPAPDALHHIRGVWGCQASDMLMVGDHVDDVLSGSAAGCKTALLRLEKNREHHGVADHCIETLWDIVEMHLGPRRMTVPVSEDA